MDELLAKLERAASLDPSEARRGFLKIIREASGNPTLGCRFGLRIAALDRRLFKRKGIPPAPAAFLASFLLFASFLVLLGLYIVVLPPIVQFIFLCACLFCFFFFSHDLAHFLVGSVLGIRFLYFFRGRSSFRHALCAFPTLRALMGRIPVWGIKIDYSHFFCISRGRRKAMFVSGVLASTFFPIFISATTWQIETESWVKWSVFALTAGNILFAIPLSYLYGDLAKARRQH